MKVSIAMATYNGEKYLSQQLESFLSQSTLPDELVISDDNSSDETLEIAKSFKKRAPFDVKILINEYNRGFVKNFEKAITHTSGELIFLSDQDDIWFSKKIETIKNEFRANPGIWVIINDQEIMEDEGQPTGLTRLGQLKRIGYSNLEFKTGCCTAFHKELIPYVIPIPSEYVNHDIWIHELGYYLQKRCVVEEVLQYYRRHERNASNGTTKELTPTKALPYFINALKIKVDDYNKNIQILEEIKRRIKKMPEDKVSKKKIIAVIDQGITAWKKRDDLAGYGFVMKRIKMIKMLMEGDYKYFNGYKSFCKDFIL